MPYKKIAKPFNRLLFLLLTILLLTITIQAATSMDTDVKTVPLFTPLSLRDSSLSARQRQWIEDIEQWPMVKRIEIVRINFDALNDDLVLINLFSEKEWIATKEKVEERKKGEFTWHGKIFEEGSQVILTRRGENLIGSIWIENEFYALKPLGQGVAAILEIDSEKFLKDFEDYSPEQEDSRMSSQLAGDDGSEMRVLIAYTNAAVGRLADITLESQQLIDYSNSTYSNSAVKPRLRLAYVTRADYTESDSFSTDLDRLANPSDGYMDVIHDLRDGSGGDFVVLIINDPHPEYCGIAKDIYAEEHQAFAVVDYRCLLNNTFSHEIGHLQGARHDEYVDPSDAPFAYGHGYSHPDRSIPADSWRTVMSYPDACTAAGTTCTWLPYWSNPDITYRGNPMGTESTNNNARVLNETAPTMANFRVLPNDIYWTVYAYFDGQESVLAAKNSVTIDGGIGLVFSGAKATIEAPTVTLKGEFKAENGSEFHAHAGY